MSDLDQVIEQYHRALAAFLQGDPEPDKRLYSRRDDVTLANPFGPPVRGWQEVEATIERAASQIRDGEVRGFERVSKVATAELAYLVEIERAQATVGGATERASIALRATTIFRREAGAWRIVHRHADPITAPRPVASVVAESTETHAARVPPPSIRQPPTSRRP
jgi:ketosteroid isomerase-like protein